MELVKSKVVFCEAEHTYTLRGKQLSGITGIIKKYITPNKYNDIPEFVLNKAAEKGSAVHKEIEMIVNGFEPYEPMEETNRFLEIAIKNEITFVESEYTVSDNSDFASNIDLVDNRYNLYDIKTTSELDEVSLSWQLSIYAYLFMLQNKMACGDLYGIWLRPDKSKLVKVEKIPTKTIIELLKHAKNNDNVVWNGQEFVTPEELEKSNFDSLSAFEEQNHDQLEKAYAIQDAIEAIELKKKELEQQQEQMRELLLQAMRENGIKKFESDKLQIVYKAPSTRTSIDSARLKSELPEIYNEFSKVSNVKDSITIKIK